MRILRLLLTVWLCLSLPYAAMASALRDPACASGPSVHPSRLAMHHHHGGQDEAMPQPVAARAADGCLLKCACIQGCTAPGFTADYSSSGTLPPTMRQEPPALPPTPARRAAALTELLRPPAFRV